MTLLHFIRANARWLAAGGLLALMSSFGQTYFISIFAGQIRQEFGLSHGGWGGLYAAGTLASAGVMVWAGVLSDRLRVRVLGPMVLAGLAVSCLLMAGNRSVWVLPVSIFLLRFFGQGMSTHVSRVAMARWFSAARGRALALSSVGFSLGEALLPLLAVMAMGMVGWRSLWVGAALILLAVIPLLRGLLRAERTPGSLATESRGLGLDGRHWRRGEVLRSALFWKLLPMVLAPPAFFTALFFQQVHLSETKSWSHETFVALIPLYTLFSIAAMMASGALADRWGAWRFLPISQLPLALGMLLIWGMDSVTGLAMAFIVFALSHGSSFTLLSAFWAEIYGTAYLGAIKSLATAIMVFGSAVGPGVTGVLIDAGLPFQQQALGIAFWVVAASILAAASIWPLGGRLSQAQIS